MFWFLLFLPVAVLLNVVRGYPAQELSLATPKHNNKRVLSSEGGYVVTRVAGQLDQTGTIGDEGEAISAMFLDPMAIVKDDRGNLYIADSEANVVRKVSSLGIITTYAGMSDFSGGAMQGICS